MKAVATEDGEQSTVADHALRLVVDTTPALIPDGQMVTWIISTNAGWICWVAR